MTKIKHNLSNNEMDWFWVTDFFMATFCNHQAAWDYHIKHNVEQLLYREELDEILISIQPWKFTDEQHKIMNEYGITDDEIVTAWNNACKKLGVSVNDFPCPLP